MLEQAYLFFVDIGGFLSIFLTHRQHILSGGIGPLLVSIAESKRRNMFLLLLRKWVSKYDILSSSGWERNLLLLVIIVRILVVRLLLLGLVGRGLWSSSSFAFVFALLVAGEAEVFKVRVIFKMRPQIFVLVDADFTIDVVPLFALVATKPLLAIGHVWVSIVVDLFAVVTVLAFLVGIRALTTQEKEPVDLLAFGPLGVGNEAHELAYFVPASPESLLWGRIHKRHPRGEVVRESDLDHLEFREQVLLLRRGSKSLPLEAVMLLMRIRWISVRAVGVIIHLTNFTIGLFLYLLGEW